MSPCSKTLSHIRLEPQYHKTSRCSHSNDKYQFGKVAASQERNNQESYKKYYSRSEVPHEAQAAEAEGRKSHEYPQVFLLEKLIQGSRPYPDKCHLYKLRWLEAETADFQPVLSSEAYGSEYEVDYEKQC